MLQACETRLDAGAHPIAGEFGDGGDDLLDCARSGTTIARRELSLLVRLLDRYWRAA